jgi:hypothetical protein
MHNTDLVTFRCVLSIPKQTNSGISQGTKQNMQYYLHILCLTSVFLKLWSADHKWSSGSALVVFFD